MKRRVHGDLSRVFILGGKEPLMCIGFFFLKERGLENLTLLFVCAWTRPRNGGEAGRWTTRGADWEGKDVEKGYLKEHDSLLGMKERKMLC